MNNKNDFDDPDNGFGFLGSIGPKAAFFIVLIALSFMIGLVWKLYTGGSVDNGDVPIVRADTDDYRIVPDEPGGMEVKFQDSTLFNNDVDDEGVENLLADDTSEKPMPRSQLFAGLNTEDNSDIENIELNDEVSEAEERIAEQTEEAKEVLEDLNDNGADAVVVLQEDEVIVVKDIDEPEVVTKDVSSEITFDAPTDVKTEVEAPKVALKPVVTETPKVEAKPASTPIASGDYFVQLASVKSKAAAESEWNNFVTKYSPLLSGVSYRIETADLGAKGIYYRIQAGPVSQAKANNICDGVKTKGGSCLVKKK